MKDADHPWLLNDEESPGTVSSVDYSDRFVQAAGDQGPLVLVRIWQLRCPGLWSRGVGGAGCAAATWTIVGAVIGFVCLAEGRCALDNRGFGEGCGRVIECLRFEGCERGRGGEGWERRGCAHACQPGAGGQQENYRDEKI